MSANDPKRTLAAILPDLVYRLSGYRDTSQADRSRIVAGRR